jgi:predicted membrane protein
MRSPGRHLFSGAIFIVVGLVFLLGNMGMVDVDRVLRFWPVILIAMGAFRLVEYRDDFGQTSGVFWIVIGSLFLLGSLGIFRMALHDLWPVVLIGLGGLMFWRAALARRGPKDFGSRPDAARYFTDSDAGGPAGPAPGHHTTEASSNSMISSMAILGSVEHRNNSQDFRGGSATAVMGACEIDLRAAGIVSGQEPVIEVFALWGGIEVRVPPDWTVISQVDPILGGYEDDTQPPKEEGKRFVIRGTVIMGGIEVTN